MENNHGGREVIAAAISARMDVPILEDLRSSLDADQYRAILELSRIIVESTAGSTLPIAHIAYALVAAAAMYAEAVDQGEALLGRGPPRN